MLDAAVWLRLLRRGVRLLRRTVRLSLLRCTVRLSRRWARRRTLRYHLRRRRWGGHRPDDLNALDLTGIRDLLRLATKPLELLDDFLVEAEALSEPFVQVTQLLGALVEPFEIRDALGVARLGNAGLAELFVLRLHVAQ